MPHPPRRVVDAARATTEHAARKLGYRSQHDIEQQGDRQGRFLDDSRRRRFVIYTDTISFFRENIGNVGDAGYTMRQATPTAVATWGSIALDAYMGAAGRIVGGRLWANAARTGGTATLRVRITEGGVATDYLLSDCVLDATNPQTIGQIIPFANGIPFAKGATIRAFALTAGTFAPDTADMAAEVLVAYEGMP